MAIVKLALLLYIVAIISLVALSWLRLERDSPASQVFVLLRRITDPVLDPVRRVFPPIGRGSGVGIDVSVTLVLFVLLVIYRVL